MFKINKNYKEYGPAGTFFLYGLFFLAFGFMLVMMLITPHISLRFVAHANAGETWMLYGLLTSINVTLSIGMGFIAGGFSLWLYDKIQVWLFGGLMRCVRS